VSEDTRKLVEALVPVQSEKLKTPLNILYASYEPERKFCRWLIEHPELFESYVKIPESGFYSFPYSISPRTQRARTSKMRTSIQTFLFVSELQRMFWLSRSKSEEIATRTGAQQSFAMVNDISQRSIKNSLRPAKSGSIFSISCLLRISQKFFTAVEESKSRTGLRSLMHNLESACQLTNSHRTKKEG